MPYDDHVHESERENCYRKTKKSGAEEQIANNLINEDITSKNDMHTNKFCNDTDSSDLNTNIITVIMSSIGTCRNFVYKSTDKDALICFIRK